MTFMSILSECGVICLYLATFGYIMLEHSEPAVFLFIAAGFFAAVCVGILLKDRGKLKYISPVFLLLCFGGGISRETILTVLPAAAYLIVRLRKDNWIPSHARVLTLFERGCVGYLVMILFFLVFNTPSLAVLSSRSLPFFAVFAVISFYELRMLRGQGIPVSFGMKYALLSFLPVPAAALAALLITSSQARWLAGAAASAVYRFLIVPLLYLFIWALLAVMEILKYPVFWIMSLFRTENQMEQILSEFGAATEELMFEVTYNTGGSWADALFRAIPAVLAVLFLIFLLRRAARQRRTEMLSGGTITRESLNSSRRRGFLASLLSPLGDPVREAYRKYLYLCMENSIPADGRLDSLQIQKQTEMKTRSDDAGRLRELWLPVRYGRGKKSDGELARRLLRRISADMKQ